MDARGCPIDFAADSTLRVLEYTKSTAQINDALFKHLANSTALSAGFLEQISNLSARIAANPVDTIEHKDIINSFYYGLLECTTSLLSSNTHMLDHLTNLTSLNDGLTYSAANIYKACTPLATPVTWQNIVWTLVALATSCMAQPAGRVFGSSSFPIRYRVYFCSSPIVCVTDALVMVFRLFSIRIYYGISLAEAAMVVMSSKFDPETQLEESVTIVLDQSAWPRWIFFILGTLPAMIKINAFSGIPFSRTTGLMYMFSFVVNEAFLLLAKARPHSESPDTLFAISEFKTAKDLMNEEVPVPPEGRNPPSLMVRGQMLMEDVGRYTAIAGHVQLWSTFSYDVLQYYTHSGAVPTGVLESFFTLQYVCVVVYVALRMLSGFKREYVEAQPVLRWLVDETNNAPFTYAASSVFGISFSINPISERGSQHVTGFRIILFSTIIIASVLLALHRVIFMICKRVPPLARALLVAPTLHTASPDQPAVAYDSDAVDSAGVWYLLFFCCNLGLCVLWYALRYDSSGTINPAWTGIFG